MVNFFNKFILFPVEELVNAQKRTRNAEITIIYMNLSSIIIFLNL